MKKKKLKNSNKKRTTIGKHTIPTRTVTLTPMSCDGTTVGWPTTC